MMIDDRTNKPARRRMRTRTSASALAGVATAALLLAALPVTGAGAAVSTLAPRAAVATGVPAVPAGKVTPRGCVSGSGTATCDLYAMAGTTTVLGTPVPIWGFSTTDAAGTATAPGPLLVVHQGDRVSITLHNQIAGQQISMALPGQSAPSFSGSVGDDTTGVAADAGRTYTFTAGRAGTFLYEAGHTANGTRQVAMGLAGALVVLPADGTAYGDRAGYPSTAYDDDAVLVLSEIDPELNANPATFDMRGFAPKYRLINGKPFPASDPIGTDQGHAVLLRYVNAGSETHAMSVLGADQVEVAQDGHAMKYASTVTAESIEPGQTLDTLVKVPTGPEAKLAVYEAAAHLNNNGQATADPLQLAFGGMLTFLDTNAPAPVTDGVGPVSSRITVSPNPSDGLADVTVTANLSDATTGGSNVAQAEVVIDDAVTTGVGFGIPMMGGFASGDPGIDPAGTKVIVTGATATIPTAVLDGLDAGKHTVFVRALDTAGNWGVVGSAILNLPKTGPQTTNGSVADVPANGTQDVAISATGDDTAGEGTITAAEYFLDTVGANGTGTAMTRNRTAAVVAESATLAAAQVTALGEGVHHVFVHSKSSLGLWGPPLDIELPVDLTGPAVDAASVGPNPSNGVLTDKGNPGYLLVSAQITDKDAGGALQSTLVDAEGFLEPSGTPAGGTGFQLVAVDAKMDSTTEAVYGLIPISQVKSLANGEHNVGVRGQDAAGNWGNLFLVKLVVDKSAPALGALAGSPNPTAGAADLTLSAPVTDASLISVAEYWLGTVDPGAGHAASLPVSIIEGKVVVTVPLGAITPGTTQFNLRVQDLAGNWSKAVNTSVVVQKPNAILSDTFDSGSLSAWSSSTGGVSVTAAAGIPVASSNQGLQVTLPGGRTNRAAYVTDTTPLAEPAYHAKFSFDRQTLTSGSKAATVLTLFEARTAANGQVFSLQYHLTGPTAQVRTVLSRSGATALTGAWVSLGTGASTLQLDWLSGPASGSSAGSLGLSVNGVSKSLQTGNTSSLRIDTALLGVTNGVTTNTTGSTRGTAYLDSFVSTRNTMP